MKVTPNMECGLHEVPATLYEDIVSVQGGWLHECRAAWWEHDGKQCDVGDM